MNQPAAQAKQITETLRAQSGINRLDGPEQLVALAAAGHAWETHSATAARLRDVMSSDDYDGYCGGIIPKDIDCDGYEIGWLMSRSGITFTDADTGDTIDGENVTLNADTVEHYRFVFLGDPAEDADMTPYDKRYAPLAWTAIGLMAVRDKTWNVEVSDKDTEEAENGRWGYGSLVAGRA
ncbi:hypothetical protein [Bifidobacterium callitrichidarum]|uniref:Uncharacterized protein n=1 Tax=Bifidobacterium callitrichidarum TaxID=2052941 RepID=A0A2U2NCE9_9BIFI|nr:hypothetical protein [Bifidobacterium callitrichidarum]PWG66760.1 hypothetical protein DF196_02335 [Bifidobacterium callitrichidarum]